MFSRDRSGSVVFLALLLAILAFSGSSAIAASCEGLASLSQPNTTITLSTECRRRRIYAARP